MSIDNSLKAFKQAQKLIPGGVNSPVRAFSSVGGTPLFIAEGNGAYLIDIDGNRYVDYVQSWGPLIFGHRDESIENAVIEAVKHGLSFGAPTQAESDLATLVISMFDSIDKIRFVSSGTEAVMSAIRLARGFTGRDDIVKFTGCYHGHSDSLLVQAGSGAATFGNPSSPGVPADFTKHTLLAEYNNIESVKKCFNDSKDIACVIIEPIAGNMGLVPADKEFLHELRKLCDENGTLLIFDEVMSGFRATLHGAESITGVKPDIVTLGKVIGGGMPVGAFGARAEIMAKLSPEGPVYQAGTLSGNPVAMAAGLAAISKLKNNSKVMSVLNERAKRLVDGMKKEAENCGIKMQIDTRGSMFGFFFNENPVKNFADACKSDAELFAAFHSMMLKEGFYFACSLYETGFISTAITDEMIEDTIKASAKVFKAISNV
ncbi:MAG: glutamate-1-semialdehyde-2,1-aminomutase [Sulfurimonas sp. RIFOXYD12_FULL_33_39]|uniref:glutamate-1-semialdehyde 2,1-aminomutase n=1 Tax=unclassified Sulfurimonas TaxID=2623549 RepID=UPI0008C0D6EA|nr:MULTISPECIES: glutamate-1-semialdehyde 2,1-aminomutase [unclassified Sulfurimonas]OHE01926.1 MAG: glutamate-1-semialdehyde-2,1-aminomutase [Sulfurimonas sp. RIFCSPLOWO2_12_FULL_34_6]OHE09428.1 MAG: glutamate-1-semialdehyde-2,1-aminomutase [Sulfurimonas sp. RIFOXYD12_FULL_33_39]OHE12790.1 MAG: glutamate-1-semialdehyde-2,1-aminomutase [Sulfurimonas sp. RIFOXYD2_FULL_34_21]DAB27556.1 MAG TPA: glutamate-1-semialdehyde-2,1-aminomutase [Sulfurimonas sp. UBA10385]